MIVTRGGGLGVERESGGRNDESQVDNDERSKSARKSLIVGLQGKEAEREWGNTQTKVTREKGRKEKVL